MAGKARLAAAMTWLEVEAGKLGVEVSEYVEEQIANGETVLSMSDRATRQSGIEITRNVLSNAIAKLCPDSEQMLKRARAQSAHAIVEKRSDEIQDMNFAAMSTEEIAGERLKQGHTQWLAERLNRADFGQNVKVEHELGPGALHLAVLKERSLARARELAALPLPTVTVEPVTDTDPEELI